MNNQSGGEFQTFEISRIAELSGAEDTQQIEMSFDELQLNFEENKDNPLIPLTANAPISLPAALVDDQLLQEIEAIPDRMGFKIGDVAEILGIKQYVLRYWETEFEVLKPKKASNNQRMYTRKDVENALLIRKLLHRDRFSIEGARQALRGFKSQVRKEQKVAQVQTRIENIHEAVEDLVLDIRRIRQLFK